MKIGRACGWIFAMGLGACAAAPQADPPAVAAKTQPAAAPASLAGTRWKAVAEAGLDPAATPWIEFTAGRMSGFTGCNLFNGAWRSDAGQVRFGPVAMTKRGCLGPAGDVEKRVLAVLNEQGRATREGGKLVLIGPGGERFEFVAG